MLRGISEPETVLASKSTNSRKQAPREMLTGTSSSLPMSMRPILGITRPTRWRVTAPINGTTIF